MAGQRFDGSSCRHEDRTCLNQLTQPVAFPRDLIAWGSAQASWRPFCCDFELLGAGYTCCNHLSLMSDRAPNAVRNSASGGGDVFTLGKSETFGFRACGSSRGFCGAFRKHLELPLPSDLEVQDQAKRSWPWLL